MDKKKLFLEMMNERHATKLFTDKKIPKEDLEFILEAGRLSPMKEAIEAVAWNQKQISTCSDLLVVLARKDVRSRDAYTQTQLGRWGLGEEGLKGLLALYKGWVDGRDDHTIEMWSEKQCYIAAANMMSAAAFIGIDSCPIEGFLYEKVDAILGIDTTVYQSALVLPFGYRAQDARGKHRLSFDEVVEFKK